MYKDAFDVEPDMSRLWITGVGPSNYNPYYAALNGIKTEAQWNKLWQNPLRVTWIKKKLDTFESTKQFDIIIEEHCPLNEDMRYLPQFPEIIIKLITNNLKPSGYLLMGDRYVAHKTNKNFQSFIEVLEAYGTVTRKSVGQGLIIFQKPA